MPSDQVPTAADVCHMPGLRESQNVLSAPVKAQGLMVKAFIFQIFSRCEAGFFRCYFCSKIGKVEADDTGSVLWSVKH